jgi:pilus assembly protein Flp/PilA
MNEPIDVKVEKNQESPEKGASLVEYALLVALIAVVAIAAVRLLGTTISQQFSAISSSLGG